MTELRPKPSVALAKVASRRDGQQTGCYVIFNTAALNSNRAALQGGDVCCATQPVRTRIPEKRMISLFSGGTLTFDQLLNQQKSMGVILLQGFFEASLHITNSELQNRQCQLLREEPQLKGHYAVEGHLRPREGVGKLFDS